MNPKFILPVSFALTAHVFFLFGLPGRAPVPATAPEDAPLPTINVPKVLLDAPIRATTSDENPETPPVSGGALAPRPDDVPVPESAHPPFTVPPLPPIAPGGGGTRIDPGWTEQQGPGGTPSTPPTDWRKLDYQPQARVQPPPVYPANMRNQGVEGAVVVVFWVDETGNAHAPTIVSASRREFEEPSLRAVARWKFEPGFKNGRRVRFSMSVPLVFRLDRG